MRKISRLILVILTPLLILVFGWFSVTAMLTGVWWSALYFLIFGTILGYSHIMSFGLITILIGLTVLTTIMILIINGRFDYVTIIVFAPFLIGLVGVAFGSFVRSNFKKHGQ